MRFSPTLLVLGTVIVFGLVITLLKPLPLIQTLKENQWEKHLQRPDFAAGDLKRKEKISSPPSQSSAPWDVPKTTIGNLGGIVVRRSDHATNGFDSNQEGPSPLSQKRPSWDEKRIAENVGEVECSFLPDGGEAIVVWAFDASPSRPLVEPLSKPTSDQNNTITTRVFCGNTECMQLHRRLPCVHAERLLIQAIAADTPIETWAREHVLHKIVSAHYYESILQVGLQLAILFKNEGSAVVGSGSSPFLLADDVRRESIVGSRANCQPTISETGLVGATLTRETTRIILEKFASLVYSAASSNEWPYKMDWRDLFSSVDCHIYADGRSDSLETARLVPRGLRYGTLTYNVRRRALLARDNTGMNLGDELQGVAGLQFLPYLDALVERDDYELTYATQDLDSPMQNKTLVFANAWYGSSMKTIFTHTPHIDPVLVAIHTEPDEVTVSKFNSSLEWMRQKWPVGVRDVSTMQYFHRQGVSAFVSNCMTTTIVPLCPERKNNSKVLMVDLGKDFVSSDFIPSGQIVESISHKSMDQVVNDSPILRYKGAFKFLRKYACDAKVVLTKRLHSALPTAASGTPVMWVSSGGALPGGGGASRVQDYFPLLHNSENISTFDWNEPHENPKKEVFGGMRNRLQAMAYCHHGAIADASVKFGTVSKTWADRLEARPLCKSSEGKEKTENIVRIVTVLDSAFLRKDVILPTFVNGIGHFNKEPIALYVLTMNLTAAQECLVRYIVTQPLHPDSIVHIVPADGEMERFTNRYIGLRHISVATMTRLALPQLLPCVSKVIWLDIDTLVLNDLKLLWQTKPDTPCGIAARTSFSAYMANHGRGPGQFTRELKAQFKTHASVEPETGRANSFNAGVMVIDMDIWRSSKDFHAAVETVALEYQNDDQLTLNYFCNGKFTELPNRWNMFRSSGLRDQVDPAFGDTEPDDWGIVHWTSSKKPWTKDFPYPGTQVGELWKKFRTTTAVALSKPL